MTTTLYGKENYPNIRLLRDEAKKRDIESVSNVPLYRVIRAHLEEALNLHDYFTELLKRRKLGDLVYACRRFHPAGKFDKFTKKQCTEFLLIESIEKGYSDRLLKYVFELEKKEAEKKKEKGIPLGISPFKVSVSDVEMKMYDISKFESEKMSKSKELAIKAIAEKLWEEAGRPEDQSEHFWKLAEEKYKQNNNGRISCWDMVESTVGRCERVLLYGVSGTGKSWAARRSNLRESQVYSVSLTEDTPAAELRGHYGLRGGEYEWMDGPCTLAWRTPNSRLCLNELEKASGDSQTFLLGILDDKEIAQQTLPTNETIRPSEGFHVVATMNGNPDQDLDPALRDRFPVCIHINEVAPPALMKLPEDVRKAAKQTGIVKDAQRQISVRVWNEFVKLREEIGEKMAAHCVFGDRAKAALDTLKVSLKK